MLGIPKLMTLVGARPLGLSVALLINIGIIVAGYFGQQEAIVQSEWVDRTRTVLKVLRQTQNAMVDAETGQRGYALTGDQAFNESYDAAVASLPKKLSALRDLIQDNPDQQAHADRLETLIAEELALLKSWSAATTAGKARSAEVADYARRGKTLMDSIREVLVEMLDEEERLYQERRAAADAGARSAQIMLIAGGVLSIGLIIGIFILMQREMGARRRSEENLEVTLNSIGDGVIATDEAGRVTRLNPVGERMTGWSEAEARGKPVDEIFRIFNEQTRQAAAVPVAQVLRSGKMVGLANHSVLILRDGREIPIADSCAPISGVRGDLLGTVLVFRDVTEERRAEAAIQSLNESLERQVEDRTRSLHRTTEMLQQIIESSPLAIVNLDRDANIVTWNRRAEEIFGYPAQEAIGRPYSDVVGTPREETLSGLREVLAGRTVRGLEIMRKRKDGANVILSASAAALTDHNKSPIGIVALFEDITQARATQNQLQQAQKMEAVGQLTGGIAHDFNNLLSIVIGNLDSLIDRLQSPVERELANEALNGALRGAELTKQMLAFARRQQLDPSPVDVGDFLQTSSAMLKRVLGEMVVVHTSVADGLWPCLADRSQLETALLNLSINARDAMPDGGALTIEAANAHLDAHYASLNPEVVPGDYVKLSISDSGSGMSPDLLTRVLEPFFTTKDPGKGTGLGLSMVHGFAKQSGGHLKIYSEPGHGTTVNLYLPRASGTEESARQSDHGAPSPVKGDETILVVDDNAGVRKTAQMQLTELGYRVIEAADAKSALDILGNGAAVDLVFSDVVMPGGMTGFDLAKEVRQLHPEIKIILVTGFAEAALRQRNGLGDSVQLLSKPYRRQELAARIRQVLDGNSA